MHLKLSFLAMYRINPVRTGVFVERLSLGGVFHPWVYSFVCKPRVFKFCTQLEMGKIYHKINIELDMTNCDISMTSLSNFVADKLKIGVVSVLV